MQKNCICIKIYKTKQAPSASSEKTCGEGNKRSKPFLSRNSLLLYWDAGAACKIQRVEQHCNSFDEIMNICMKTKGRQAINHPSKYSRKQRLGTAKTGEKSRSVLSRISRKKPLFCAEDRRRFSAIRTACTMPETRTTVHAGQRRTSGFFSRGPATGCDSHIRGRGILASDVEGVPRICRVGSGFRFGCVFRHPGRSKRVSVLA